MHQARTHILTAPAYENGTSALLLLLSGTLPVTFRGATYGFPVAIWVPYAYPREPPIVFITPSQDMVVRPGQHVSGDGRVYHPYLAQWGQYWDVRMLCAGHHGRLRFWIRGMQGLLLGRNLHCSTSLPFCEASSPKNHQCGQGNRRMRPRHKLPLSSLHHQQNGGDPLKVLEAPRHHLLQRTVAQRLLHGLRNQASKARKLPNRRMTATHGRHLCHHTNPNNKHSRSISKHPLTAMGPRRTGGSSSNLILLRRAGPDRRATT
jgi:hypothetical protein